VDRQSVLSTIAITASSPSWRYGVQAMVAILI
jgi:hypothetical protein